MFANQDRRRHTLDEIQDRESGGDTVEDAILELKHIDVDVVDNLIGKLLKSHGHAQAIGIGVPGVAHCGVIGVCDVPELAGKSLGPYLEEKYSIPVMIENDMNMTVYGFYHVQNFEEEKTFAVVTFPKNHFPGAGFIVNGQILSGNTKFAGEVSFYLLVSPGRSSCCNYTPMKALSGWQSKHSPPSLH